MTLWHVHPAFAQKINPFPIRWWGAEPDILPWTFMSTVWHCSCRKRASDRSMPHGKLFKRNWSSFLLFLSYSPSVYLYILSVCLSLSLSHFPQLDLFHDLHVFLSLRCLCVSTNICMSILLASRAVRRRHCVGGGAPPVQKNRRRRGVGGQNSFFLIFTKKFRSILNIFLLTFLVIKALRFADDQC